MVGFVTLNEENLHFAFQNLAKFTAETMETKQDQEWLDVVQLIQTASRVNFSWFKNYWLGGEYKIKKITGKDPNYPPKEIQAV